MVCILIVFLGQIRIGISRSRKYEYFKVNDLLSYKLIHYSPNYMVDSMLSTMDIGVNKIDSVPLLEM